MYMSNFCCSVIRVLVPDANLLPGGSQLSVTHIPLITLLRPRYGVNLSGRLLDMQLRYVQSLKIVIITIFCNLRVNYSQVVSGCSLLAYKYSSATPVFLPLSAEHSFFHQVLILAKNDYSPGFSDKPGFTRSWLGSKLGPEPIRCCRTRP